MHLVINIYVKGLLWIFNELMSVKHIKHCLAQNGLSIIVSYCDYKGNK